MITVPEIEPTREEEIFQLKEFSTPRSITQ